MKAALGSVDGNDLGGDNSFQMDEVLSCGGLGSLSLVLTQRTWCKKVCAFSMKVIGELQEEL